ncbi:peptidyl-tRNA hydrolase [Vibrio phage 1.081.O._10N.286.52.C2]|nr:peptidyl-tRNA hydrolase [Vibrio phage 1.081.O._10N.286.52.C2]
MKAYCFVNRYCIGIQAGIQAAHALVRLGEMRDDSGAYKKWANEEETLCVLSASDHDHLANIEMTIKEMDLDIPVASFQEAGLNNSLTAVAFIADERIIKIQQEVYEWRELRKRNEGKTRGVFDSDMFYRHGQRYALVKYLQEFKSHNG